MKKIIGLSILTAFTLISCSPIILLQQTELKQRSNPKSIHQQKIRPAKMPLWKQAVIALSVLVVLIGLYIVLVFSEIFAFGN